MTDNDFERFTAIIVATAEMYREKLSDMVIALYWQTLKHLSLEQSGEQSGTGISEHISNPETGHFRPKPADILRPFIETS